MKNRILPTIIGLTFALLFSFNKSILFSHIMYLCAAAILYIELIGMSQNFHRQNTDYPRSKHSILLITGFLTLFCYMLSHTWILQNHASFVHNQPLFLKISISHLEVASTFIFIYTLFCFVLIHYILNIFVQNKAKPVFADSFQNLLIGFHALFYSTFFLYSLVKIKYAYLYIDHPALNTQTSLVLLLLTWILIWLYDSMAYIGGAFLGKRKLKLSVSPQKSWAGLIFGTFSLIVVLTLFQTLGLPQLPTEFQQLWFFKSFGHSILFSIIIAFTTQLGDLIASFFKRASEIKDSGSLFGAHGGFLDRNDSAILTFTLLYQLLVWTL